LVPDFVPPIHATVSTFFTILDPVRPVVCPGTVASAGTVPDAGPIVDAGSIADARPIVDARSIADARPIVDAGSIADARPIVDARSIPDAGAVTDSPTGAVTDSPTGALVPARQCRRTVAGTAQEISSRTSRRTGGDRTTKTSPSGRRQRAWSTRTGRRFQVQEVAQIAGGWPPADAGSRPRACTGPCAGTRPRTCTRPRTGHRLRHPGRCSAGTRRAGT
jgi:hypothetical protein